MTHSYMNLHNTNQLPDNVTRNKCYASFSYNMISRIKGIRRKMNTCMLDQYRSNSSYLPDLLVESFTQAQIFEHTAAARNNTILSLNRAFIRF